MGMLRNGCWVEQDDIIRNKVFQRAASSIRVHAPGAIAKRITERPGDFWLIGSYSCPWSHRTLLMRAIKQLPLPVHYAFGPRREGYSLNGGEAWKIPGSSKSARHLHELYTKHDPTYSGRVTVPVLWDSDQQQIITNESAEILTILDAVETQNGFDCTLRPFALRSEMEVANARMYHGLNNAVYRAGFAQSQDAYEEAVATVFETLDFLEQRLAMKRFYFGTMVTETDLRILPTLIRFDAIYAILFKCSLRRLIDYSNLWAYARDLYRLKGVAETIDCDQMRRASYLADSRDPHPIIAIAPEVDWFAPHGRAALGPIQFAKRFGPGLLDLPHCGP